MWKIVPCVEWEKDKEWYQKKRPAELAAVLHNFKRYMKLLEVSRNSRCVMAGFLHPEPCGVIAIDQSRGGGNLQETRLYTFADDSTKTVYIITVGNKDDQPSDVMIAKEFVEYMRQLAVKAESTNTPE